MGFRLEITKKKCPLGAETERVSVDEITLANALEMIVLMFCSRGRRPVLVTEFGPQGISIYFEVYIGLLGDKPTVLPDQVLAYSGGFGFRFEPLSEQDYDQLIEMLAAYLIAYPELGSDAVNQQIQRVKPAA